MSQEESRGDKDTVETLRDQLDQGGKGVHAKAGVRANMVMDWTGEGIRKRVNLDESYTEAWNSRKESRLGRKDS